MSEIALSNLTRREAIADALYRCVLGMDSNNRALFESACNKDDMVFTGGGFTLTGYPEISNFFERIWNLTTSHYTSNMRIDVKSDDATTAKLTCHSTAYHMRPSEALAKEDTSYTAGGLYDIELVRIGEGWKIRRWDITVLWTTGDSAIVHA